VAVIDLFGKEGVRGDFLTNTASLVLESLYGIHYSRFLLIFSKGTSPYSISWIYSEYWKVSGGWTGFIYRETWLFSFQVGNFIPLNRRGLMADSCRKESMAFRMRNMEK